MSDAEKKQDHQIALSEVTARFPERITRAVGQIMETADDPVARQYLPDIRELDIQPYELPDPIGDQPHSPVKGIVHRYNNRVLLKAASVCAVNCRFCFRKNMLATPEQTLNTAEMENALHYIETQNEINEVILTGGDPLILSPEKLSRILRRLDEITHVKFIRIHTRTPVAYAEKLDTNYLEILKCKKPLYMVLHINHAQEITPRAEQLFATLHKQGVTLLSQSVLLKNINDNEDALAALFEKLITLHIKPYYLHHPDLVPGTGHFRITIEKGQQLMRALRGRLSGLAVPAYVLDIPGGYGKIPLESPYVTKTAKGYELTDYAGNTHLYPVD